MIILGLNGLGRWGFHDPSACVLVDGRLTHFVEEERLLRIKHAPGQAPRKAARSCLDACGLHWYDVDKVAFGWDLPSFALRAAPELSREDLCRMLLRDAGAPEDFPTSRVEFVPHHVAHAWSGLLLAGTSPALVIVVDGQGEVEATSVFRFSGTKLDLLENYDARFSLGYLFEAASWYLGLGLRGTGKLMGLAAYAPACCDIIMRGSGHCVGELTSPVPAGLLGSFPGSVDDSKAIVEGFWMPFFKERFPGVPLVLHGRDATFQERDRLIEEPDALRTAAFAQANVETAVEMLVSRHLQEDDRAIVLTGGVALNCCMNGLITRQFPGREVHIPPVPHDAGTALGAAICLAFQDDPASIDLGEFPFTGRSFSDAEIEHTCFAAGLKPIRLEHKARLAAEMIHSGSCIGWFQGAAEVGPRALGARSILAGVSDPRIRDHLNKKVKAREHWRPFGPMILECYQQHLFNDITETPYMIKSFPLRLNRRNSLGAVTHVDGSTRPQTVHAKGSTIATAQLLEAMGELCGVLCVLNTSFNPAGEPIVYSPEDALDAFKRMPLDALFLEDWLIQRPGG